MHAVKTTVPVTIETICNANGFHLLVSIAKGLPLKNAKTARSPEAQIQLGSALPRGAGSSRNSHCFLRLFPSGRSPQTSTRDPATSCLATGFPFWRSYLLWLETWKNHVKEAQTQASAGGKKVRSRYCDEIQPFVEFRVWGTTPRAALLHLHASQTHRALQTQDMHFLSLLGIA